jgi:hypothetical protein
MAAFGATALVTAERKTTASDVAVKGNVVYARTFTFQSNASDTVAGPIDITGIKVPPGVLFLGGVVKPTKTSDGTVLSTGSTTLAFNTKTAGVTFSAATAYTAEAAMPVTVGLITPTTATADDTLQVTTASATLPAFAMTFYVTLLFAPVGIEPAPYTTLSA